MFAEYTASARFPAAGQAPGVEIGLSLRLEVPGEAGVDVAIGLLYEPELPPAIQDVLHQRLYDGVHGGLADDRPLPQGGVAVTITGLRLLPAPDAAASTHELSHVGRLLQVVTTWAVATLWEGLVATNESRL